MRIYFYVAMGLLLAYPGDVQARPCQWKVSGQVVDRQGKPVAGARLKIDARWTKPRGLWNDPNWPDKTTNSAGRFSMRSRNLNPTCRKKRDVRLRIKVGKKWIGFASKRTSKKTVNFGKIEIDSVALGKKAGCRVVQFDSPLTIGDRPLAAGVAVKASLKPITAGQLRSWKFSAPLETTTGSGGRLRGSLTDCTRSGRPGKKTRIHLAYRLEFHAGVAQVRTRRNRHTARIAFPALETIAHRPVPKVRFRLPIEKPRNIHKPGGLGPHGVDHGPWLNGRQTVDKGTDAECSNYQGKLNFAHCYKGHKGTDYMLKGGFPAMQRAHWVVAAADGYITRYSDGYFDGCHPGVLKANDPADHRTKDCGRYGEEGEDGRKTTAGANFIHIDHGNGIVTQYWHFKRGSVAKALERLGMSRSKIKQRQRGGTRLSGANRIAVKCGDRLGQIGSSGYSSAPHLHFEVRHGGEPVDPYKGHVSPHSYWVSQGRPNALPGTRCQK